MSAWQKFKKRWFLPKEERGNIDIFFLILVFCLLAFGLVMIASASYVSALNKTGDSYAYIRRQLIYAVVGIVGMLIVSRLRYQGMRGKTAIILLGIAFLFLIMVKIPGIGLVRNGARRWLGFGGFTFQPSEIAKLAIIVFFSSYMSMNYRRMGEFSVGILRPVIILAAVCGLVAWEPHVSGAILIFAVGVVLIFAGGASLKWFFGIGLTGGGILAILAVSLPYARQRIYTWLHPFENVLKEGYQTVQSLYAIGSGGPFGLGLGQSRQKYLYIPEPQNDYIFSIVCEELGFIGAMLVIILFVLLIWRGFYIAFHAKDKFGSLLVIGITSRVALQAILNIGVVTNTVPPTGISLPFFSYGGTALVLLLVEMGIVLAISRQARMEAKQ